MNRARRCIACAQCCRSRVRCDSGGDDFAFCLALVAPAPRSIGLQQSKVSCYSTLIACLSHGCKNVVYRLLKIDVGLCFADAATSDSARLQPLIRSSRALETDRAGRRTARWTAAIVSHGFEPQNRSFGFRTASKDEEAVSTWLTAAWQPRAASEPISTLRRRSAAKTGQPHELPAQPRRRRGRKNRS